MLLYCQCLCRHSFFVIVSDLLELKEICEGLCIACISLDCPFLHCPFGILLRLGAGVCIACIYQYCRW